jgi:hypothetical protein
VLTRMCRQVIALAFGVVLTLAYRPVIAVVSAAANVPGQPRREASGAEIAGKLDRSRFSRHVCGA